MAGLTYSSDVLCDPNYSQLRSSLSKRQYEPGVGIGDRTKPRRRKDMDISRAGAEKVRKNQAQPPPRGFHAAGARARWTKVRARRAAQAAEWAELKAAHEHLLDWLSPAVGE